MGEFLRYTIFGLAVAGVYFIAAVLPWVGLLLVT